MTIIVYYYDYYNDCYWGRFKLRLLPVVLKRLCCIIIAILYYVNVSHWSYMWFRVDGLFILLVEQLFRKRATTSLHICVYKKFISRRLFAKMCSKVFIVSKLELQPNFKVKLWNHSTLYGSLSGIISFFCKTFCFRHSIIIAT